MLDARRLKAFSAALILLVFPLVGACENRSARGALVVENTVSNGFVEIESLTHANTSISSDGVLYFDALGSIAALDLDDNLPAEILLSGTAWFSKPKVSPDGTYIAFISDEDPRCECLWVARISDLNGRSKAYKSDVHSFSWIDSDSIVVSAKMDNRSPSLRLAFIDAYGHQNEPGQGGEDGVRPSYFEKDQFFVEMRTPRNSPGLRLRSDGERERDRWAVGLYDRGSAEFKVLPNLRPDCSYSSPTYSDVSEVLVFIRHSCERFPSESRLVLYSPASGESRVLHFALGIPDQDDSIYNEPLWVPEFTISQDGQKIYLNSQGQLLEVELDSGRANVISFSARIPIHPTATSPNDRKLKSLERREVRGISDVAVSSDLSRVVYEALGAIWKWDPAGKENVRVSNSSHFSFDPSISTYGEKVIYATYDPARGSQVIQTNLNTLESEILFEHSGLLVEPSVDDNESILCFVLVKEPKRSLFRVVFVREFQCIDSDAQSVILKSDINTLTALGAEYYYGRSGVSRSGHDIYFSDYYDEKEDIGGGAKMQLSVNSIIVVNRGTRERAVQKLPKEALYGDLSPSGNSFFFVIATAGHRFLTVRRVPDTYPPIDGMDEPHLERVDITGCSHVSWVNDNLVSMICDSEVRILNVENASINQTFVIRHKWPKENLKSKTLFVNGVILAKPGEDDAAYGYILIAEDTIAAVGHGAVPADLQYDRIIDLENKFVMPGFVDAHTHHRYTAISPEGLQPYYKRSHWTLDAHLTHGITTLFDVQTDGASHMILRELVDAGKVRGPRLFTTGSGIGLPLQITLDHQSIVDQIVESFVGYDVIGLKGYRIRDRAAMQWLVRAANEAGLPVFVHTEHRLRDQLVAVKDGASAIEHQMFATPIYDDVSSWISAHGAGLTSTVVASTRVFLIEEWLGAFELPIHPEQFISLTIRRDKPANSEKTLDTALRRAIDVVKLHKADVEISIGGHGNLQGPTFHMEMWLLSLAGLDNSSILEAATINGARKLRLEHKLGSLEVGKKADFIVIDGNPLDDIRLAKNIVGVVVDGKHYYVDEIVDEYKNRVRVRNTIQ